MSIRTRTRCIAGLEVMGDARRRKRIEAAYCIFEGVVLAGALGILACVVWRML